MRMLLIALGHAMLYLDLNNATKVRSGAAGFPALATAH
jgi:hypothetical protein